MHVWQTIQLKWRENHMAIIDTIALILVIVGGLNWGSIGIFGVDVVASIFGGQMAAVSRVIYTLVGLGALWSITLLFKDKVPASERQAYHHAR